jgi:S-adenosyl-L-methionine hydrolase (adenosine-forming)
MAVVTFTTDFGTRDGYAAALKGVVLSLAPDAVLVDITHEIPARDVGTGAFTLAQATPYYPPGTIHVAVVDPGVGGARADLVVAAGGSYFVGPDNGLLSLAAPSPRRAWRIENPAFRRAEVSPTFHGRDVFAPAAARLATGAPPESAGPEMAEIAALEVRSGALSDGAQGEVVHVDSFGNLVTSFEAKSAPTGKWELELDGRRFALSTGRTFSDVSPGELLLYAGSGGRLEIAVRDGSAAGRLGAGWGAPVTLRRRA